MKTTATVITIAALCAASTTSAFSPLPPTAARSSSAIPRMSLIDGQSSGDAKKDEMFEAQQQLQQDRIDHSGSKEERREKYDEPPVVSSDKMHEVADGGWTSVFKSDKSQEKGEN